MKNKKKKKLLIITGTRAEYGLLKTTILKLSKSKAINLKLLATGMHTLHKYSKTLNEIKKDFSINAVITIKGGDDMINALSREIVGIKSYIIKNKIDAILVTGDRDEAFAGAVAGIHLNIPVIHISGGDVSGPTVDHYLRNAITIFSKLHLVQTKQSERNVISLGADKKNVFIVGSAGLDGLKPSKLMDKKSIAKELNLQLDKKWILMSMHPTPFEEISCINQISPVINALKRLGNQTEKIIIYPNSDTGSNIFIRAIEPLRSRQGYHLFKNIGRDKYLSLLYNCNVLVGNTSSGLMEAGYLKKPYVLVGNRQNNRERGKNTIAVPYDEHKIIKAIQSAKTTKFRDKMRKSKSVYRGGDVSGKIVEKIEKFFNQ